MATVKTLNPNGSYKIGDIVKTNDANGQPGEMFQVILTRNISGPQYTDTQIANALFKYMVNNYLKFPNFDVAQAERSALADLRNEDPNLTYNFNTWKSAPNKYDLPFDFKNMKFKPNTREYIAAIDLSDTSVAARRLNEEISDLFTKARGF